MAWKLVVDWLTGLSTSLVLQNFGVFRTQKMLPTELRRVVISRMQVLKRSFPSSFLRIANLEGETGLV